MQNRQCSIAFIANSGQPVRSLAFQFPNMSCSWLNSRFTETNVGRMISTASTSSIVSISLLSILVFRNWRFNLNLTINLLHLSNLLVNCIYPITSVKSDNKFGLALFRFILENMPKFNTKVDRIVDICEAMKVDSTDRTPVRLYYPKKAEDTISSPLAPVIIYFHGGGFVLGSIASAEHVCTGLAAKTGFVVASVEYRLAPEHKFPAGPIDCIAATKWIFEHGAEYGIDSSKVVVAGDSAGGNLAAIVSQQLPDIVKFQVLIYPAIPTIGKLTDSVLENSSAPVLSESLMMWFKLQYYNTYRDMDSPLSCPLNNPRGLKNLAPALVITASMDVLRDEGEEYARLLEAEGNVVQLRRYSNTVHGFFGYHIFPHEIGRAHV